MWQPMLVSCRRHAGERSPPTIALNEPAFGRRRPWLNHDRRCVVTILACHEQLPSGLKYIGDVPFGPSAGFSLAKTVGHQVRPFAGRSIEERCRGKEFLSLRLRTGCLISKG